MEKVDITIIGAGIIGLAVSVSVSQLKKAVFVLEKNTTFGQDASSRNSEVIHSGIYYPQNSIKADTCVEGNHLIYEICEKNNIQCKKLGKLIVACATEEINNLERLLENGRLNGVAGLKILTKKQICNMEPDIKAEAALYSPSAGIVDSHNLMRYFFQRAKTQGADFVFQSEVIRIEKKAHGFQVTVREADGSHFSFITSLLINCAGLNSDLVAELAGIDIKDAGYVLKFCKGEYFRFSGRKDRPIKHLIYPTPDKKGISLGIHVTPDLSGSLRLGPDAQYIERNQDDYSVHDSKKEKFCQSVNRFLPFITSEDMIADTAGIRPKLQGPENGFRDFVISDEQEKGLTGLINLIGIDSPGLTAAPAIARQVGNIAKKLL